MLLYIFLLVTFLELWTKILQQLFQHACMKFKLLFPCWGWARLSALSSPMILPESWPQSSCRMWPWPAHSSHCKNPACNIAPYFSKSFFFFLLAGDYSCKGAHLESPQLCPPVYSHPVGTIKLKAFNVVRASIRDWRQAARDRARRRSTGMLSVGAKRES